jgi:hypothetical protein
MSHNGNPVQTEQPGSAIFCIIESSIGVPQRFTSHEVTKASGEVFVKCGF